MYNLQKPFARKFLSAVFLVSLIFFGRYNVFPQKSKLFAAPVFNKCWEYATEQIADYNLASDNDGVLSITLLGGKLLSIDLKSGEKLWETELGGEIVSAPHVHKETTYIAVKNASAPENKNHSTGDASDDNILNVRSLNKTTGLTLWNAKLTDRFSSEKVYLYNSENSLIVVGDGGEIYSIDKITGRTLWMKNLLTTLSAQPLIGNERIFLGTADRRIIGLSLNDGRLVEEWKMPASPVTFTESVNGDELIWGDGKGSLTALGKKSKEPRWKFRNGAEISNLILTQKGLLVTSFDNFIYLISEASGKLIWKKRMSGRIVAEPLITKDYLVINTTDDSFASVVELNGGKLINRITLENDDIFISKSIYTKDYFIYATRKGILSFSEEGKGCLTK